MRQFVYYVCYVTYQEPLYLWWMETLLKCCEAPKYHVQDCRFYFSNHRCISKSFEHHKFEKISQPGLQNCLPSDVCAHTNKIKIMHTSVHIRQLLHTPFSRNIQCQTSSSFKLIFTFLSNKSVLFTYLFLEPILLQTLLLKKIWVWFLIQF